jgi:hypothetical protein
MESGRRSATTSAGSPRLRSTARILATCQGTGRAICPNVMPIRWEFQRSSPCRRTFDKCWSRC